GPPRVRSRTMPSGGPHGAEPAYVRSRGRPVDPDRGAARLAQGIRYGDQGPSGGARGPSESALRDRRRGRVPAVSRAAGRGAAIGRRGAVSRIRAGGGSAGALQRGRRVRARVATLRSAGGGVRYRRGGGVGVGSSRGGGSRSRPDRRGARRRNGIAGRS